MASSQPPPTSMALIERIDIHKSCKALETIVNVFNDYCQAAEALAIVQKKLCKALKDAAGLKATNDLAGNAMSAVASLLESLSEVDAKFVKIADKECESASNDLKKWFKKLAKEEKNHDDRIATANAKIKQAGQTYEKKAKKRDRDAAEEHTKYVNLLSVVGPEMSQEKYNHALFVTQRHTSTLYNVTSSISRTADAEWTRVCECVRRFAPVIGRISECRAYLEGEWTASMPTTSLEDQRGNDRGEGGEERATMDNGRDDESRGGNMDEPSAPLQTEPSAPRSPAPVYTPASSTGAPSAPPSTSSSQIPASSLLSAPSPTQRRPLAPPSSFPAAPERPNTDSVRSIDSLSSFPVPPTHFPLPAVAQGTPSPASHSPSTARVAEQRREDGNTEYFPRARVSSSPGQRFPAAEELPNGSSANLAPVTESPTSMNVQLYSTTPSLTDDTGRSPMSSQGEPTTPRDHPGAVQHEEAVTIKARDQSPKQRRRESLPPAMQESEGRERRVSEYGQYSAAGEGPSGGVGKGGIERTESVTSTNSVVASMRDKWGRGDVSSSPPREREIPRLPNKVADLASRYTPLNDSPVTPLSPRATGQGSPTADRPRTSPFQERQLSSGALHHVDASGSPGTALSSRSPVGPPSPSLTAEDIARRRRRLEELEELELREQAHVLRERERQLEARTMELERERERLRLPSAGARTSSSSSATAVRPHSQYSYSAASLAPPRAPGSDAPARPVSQYGEPRALGQGSASSSSVSIARAPSDHAPYCGCYACSAVQYSAPPKSAASQPVPVEKPRGWMRRLSMPVVGGAFSSDAKKGTGASSVGAGAGRGGGGAGLGIPSEDGRLVTKRSYEQDASGGISNIRPRKLSFGRR